MNEYDQKRRCCQTTEWKRKEKGIGDESIVGREGIHNWDSQLNSLVGTSQPW